jgi:DNA polymerase III sliding clamp (beta) subunit (PCNA family)
MPTIPLKSVKLFKNKASKISKNHILPICSYLLFDFNNDECTITKNNLSAFISETFPASGAGKFLIDEKILFNFVETNKGEFIEITQAKNRVTLSNVNNGQISNAESPTDDASMFPVNELPHGEGSIIDPSLVSEIKTAARLTIDAEIPTAKNFVFVGKGIVAGSDAVVGYISKTDFPIELILRKEVILSLPDTGVTHFKNNSYDFFVSGNATIGFSKSEFSFFDFTKFMDIGNEKVFEINKADIVDFNDMAIGSAISDVITASWSFNNNEMILESLDVMCNVKVNRKLPIQGTGSFSYLPNHMNKLLKALPGEQLHFYKSENKYYITDADKSFVSLIMKVV